MNTTQRLILAYITALTIYYLCDLHRLTKEAKYWKASAEEWRGIARKWGELCGKISANRDEWMKMAEDRKEKAKEKTNDNN